MKKKSHPEFVRALKARNLKITVVGTYENCLSRVAVRCDVCGWEWAPVGGSLIIGKTKCDEIKNEMRPSWRKAWSKRNATKISHTRKNTVRTTTKRCSNGIFLSQKQRSLRSLLVIANHPLLLSTTTRFRGTDGPLDAVDDPPVALGVSVDHIERKHRQHKLSLHCLE